MPTNHNVKLEWIKLIANKTHIKFYKYNTLSDWFITCLAYLKNISRLPEAKMKSPIVTYQERDFLTICIFTNCPHQYHFLKNVFGIS